MSKRKNQPKKKAKASSKKLEDLNQTHGMVDKQAKYEPTTLDQVWGDDGLSKYKTMDPDEYENRIQAMDLADLKQEAIRVGLLPVDSSTQLRDRLKNEFLGHINSFKKPASKPSKPITPGQDVLDILKEGR